MITLNNQILLAFYNFLKKTKDKKYFIKLYKKDIYIYTPNILLKLQQNKEQETELNMTADAKTLKSKIESLDFEFTTDASITTQTIERLQKIIKIETKDYHTDKIETMGVKLKYINLAYELIKKLYPKQEIIIREKQKDNYKTLYTICVIDTNIYNNTKPQEIELLIANYILNE